MNRYRLAHTLSSSIAEPSSVDGWRLKARTRIAYHLIFLFALVNLCTSATVAYSQSSTESNATPPHVVLILADDLHAETDGLIPDKNNASLA